MADRLSCKETTWLVSEARERALSLEERQNLSLCICLVDSTIPAQGNDQQLLDSLRSMGREFIVVGTKADRLSGNGRARAKLKLMQDLGLNEILLCSAKTGDGLKELWSRIFATANA